MTTGVLEVQIPWMRYDVTMPLIEGRVTIDDVKLLPSRGTPNGTVLPADSPLKSGEFDLCDLNIANWLPAIEAGWELIGLPIFTKRKHLYTYMFCRADGGINSPKDLEGKRVLSTITSSSVAIWSRALLETHHGVDIDVITWVSPREQWPIHSSRWKIEPLDKRKTVVEVLLEGDADATMVDVSDRKLFQTLESDPRFKRVVPDYLEESARRIQETGIFYPVHMIVMSKNLDRRHPALAGKLCAAFAKAKLMAYDDLLDDRSGFTLFDIREKFQAQMRQMGDLFPQGLEGNRRAIDRFISQCRAQGVIRNDVTDDSIFAASSLDT